MNKYWYVVQDEAGVYLLGFCYGASEAGEEEIVEMIKEWCRDRAYRLALLVQVFPLLPIINQVFPERPTEESARCLEYALEAIAKQ